MSMDQPTEVQDNDNSSAASSFDFSQGSNRSQGREKIHQDDSNDGHVGYDSDGSVASSIAFSDNTEHPGRANRPNEVHRDDDADSAASSFDFDEDGMSVQDDHIGGHQDGGHPHEIDNHHSDDDGNRADSEDDEQYEQRAFFPKSQPIHIASSLPPSSSPGASSVASSIAFDDTQQPGGDAGLQRETTGPSRRGKYHGEEEAAASEAPVSFIKPRAPSTSTYLPSSIVEAIRRNGPSASAYRSALHYFEAAAQTAETQSIYNGESFARKLKFRHEARVKAQDREAKITQQSKSNKRQRTRTRTSESLIADNEIANASDESWLTGHVRTVALRNRQEGHDQSTIRWERCLTDTQGTQAIAQEAIRWKGIGDRGAFSGI